MKIKLAVRLGASSLLLFAAIQSTMPLPVFAGVFSFIGELVKERKAEAYAETREVSVRNMDLLVATANPNPSMARGGGDITVDGGALVAESGVSGTIADIEGTRHPSNISVYVVREGDTLSEIADMFDVSVNTIKWANDLSGSIREGQTLVILPVSGTRHKVAKGDTLQSIAKKYKGSLEEITQFNGLKENAVLAVGDTLIIPDGEVPAVAPAARSLNKSSAPSYDGYYVRPIAGGRRTQGVHGYNAVDLGAPIGTQIVASADGTVIVAKEIGWNGGYGTYVVIAHSNGTQTLYAHMSDLQVSQGESVGQGQAIGHIGMTGKTTGPHVHFELRGAKNPF